MIYQQIPWKPDPRLLERFPEAYQSETDTAEDILETNRKNGLLSNECRSTHNAFVDSWDEYIDQF